MIAAYYLKWGEMERWMDVMVRKSPSSRAKPFLVPFPLRPRLHLALVSTTTRNSHVKLPVSYWKENWKAHFCETGGVWLWEQMSTSQNHNWPKRRCVAPQHPVLSVLLSLRDTCSAAGSHSALRSAILPTRESDRHVSLLHMDSLGLSFRVWVEASIGKLGVHPSSSLSLPHVPSGSTFPLSNLEARLGNLILAHIIGMNSSPQGGDPRNRAWAVPTSQCLFGVWAVGMSGKVGPWHLFLDNAAILGYHRGWI